MIFLVVFLDTVVKPRYDRGKIDPRNNTSQE
ncbi:MAG: palindromic element RPE4 domain-containing protein [Rickettsia endosymbiont of Ecitomorpha arachnoides]|nr:palindromic element RPE4 domain-containing protein [Rickettsia endosymbiont of Ecitomorpha arachnoides]